MSSQRRNHRPHRSLLARLVEDVLLAPILFLVSLVKRLIGLPTDDHHSGRRSHSRRHSLGRLLALLLEPFYYARYLAERGVSLLFRRRRHGHRRSSVSHGSSELDSKTRAPQRKPGGVVLGPFYYLLFVFQALIKTVLRRFRRSRHSKEQSFTSRREAIAFWLAYPFRLFADIFLDWANFRDRRALLWGLPALLAAIIGSVVVVMVTTKPDQELIRRYERAAYLAYEDALQLQQEDKSEQAETRFEEAIVFYQRLCNLKNDTRPYRYQLALIADAQGETQKAAGLMRQLIEGNQEYSRAHFWLGEQYARMAEKVEEGSEDQLVRRLQAKTHLDRALVLEPDLSAAKVALINHRLVSPTQTLELLRDVAKDDPQYRLPFVMTLARASVDDPTKRKEAVDYASRLTDELKAQIDDAKRLAMDEQEKNRLLGEKFGSLLQCYWLAGQFLDAHHLLDAEISTLGLETTRELRSSTFAQEAIAKLREQSSRVRDIEELTEIVNLTANALRFDPDNPTALALLDYLLLESSKEDSEQIMRLIDQRIVKQEATTTMCLAAGKFYQSQGDVRAAAYYYRHALGMAHPEAHSLRAQIHNNLAHARLNQTTPDIADALSEAEMAIQEFGLLTPSEQASSQLRPKLFDTRGTILMAAKRYDEAFADFDTALKERSGFTPAALRSCLSRMLQCCRELGRSSDAEFYERMLETLQDNGPTGGTLSQH